MRNVRKKGPLIEVIEFTDPYCTWCWGSEPVLRKIMEVYGEQVKIGFKMGGLVADIHRFYDPANEIGGANWFSQVAAHWLDASSRHGMPVDEKIFYDYKDEFHSTYPANIAYKSAEFQGEEKANKLLRRMREAASAERKPIHKLEIQAALAQEVGLDRDKFLENINNGRAEEAFYKDLMECRSMGVTGFPTFLIRRKDGQAVMLHGYHTMSSFEAAFNKLLVEELTTKPMQATEENIHAFVKKYGKVATKEVEEVFGLRKESAVWWLDKLKEKGLVREQKAGNGSFYLA